MNFADQIRQRLSRDVFSDNDLHLVFSDKSTSAVLSGLSRSLRSSDIQKLKRGLYIFGDRLRRNSVENFYIANLLYAPSYISFESALSFHGLIPEAVFVTTSACQQNRKKYFKTMLGDFSFDHLPCSPFYLGVEKYQVKGGAIIATPLRALFDLVYQRRSKYQKATNLEDDLRIDLDDLAKNIALYKYKDIHDLALSYSNERLERFFHVLMRDLT